MAQVKIDITVDTAKLLASFPKGGANSRAALRIVGYTLKPPTQNEHKRRKVHGKIPE